MLNPDELSRAINLLGSRYATCMLLAKRARQLSWKESNRSIGASVQQALDDIIYGRIQYWLPVASTSTQLQLGSRNNILLLESNPTPLLLTEKATQLADYAVLSLFALSRAHLEDDGRVFVGKRYAIETGVSSSAQPDFQSQPFEISISAAAEKIPFDFLIHVLGDIKLLSPRQRHLAYNPFDADLQVVDFRFEPLSAGPNSITIDCYYERRWLRTFEFNFESVELEIKAVA